MQQMLITEGKARTDLFEKLKKACETGISAIQIREKAMEANALFELTSRLAPIACAHHVLLLVNDRIDIAIAANVAGVHFPEAGLSPSIAKQLNLSLLVGCSVHSLEAAIEKEAQGADYLLFGPIFRPVSKPYSVPQTLESLRRITSHVKIPVIALGGIDSKKIPACIQAGASGIAGISCYWNESNIEKGIIANAKALSHS